MKVHGDYFVYHQSVLRLIISLDSARSVVEQRAVTGHLSDKMIDPYIGHTITLDTQSSFLDMPLQQGLIR